MNHGFYAHYTEVPTLTMWFTLTALVISLVAIALYILLVHIDKVLEARLSIRVNSRYTRLRHLSVSDLNELQ